VTQTFYPLTIESVEPLTDDAIAVRFHTDAPEAFLFKPGQYLTLKRCIDGEELIRPYSICSSPRQGLRVAIRRLQGGAFSTHAVKTFAAGVVVEALPPQGNMTVTTDAASARGYLLIGAGSGITPLLSIARSVLEEEPASTVTLIYGNRRSSTMMFREDLCGLKNAYLQRFMWINVFSQEAQEAPLLNGRIDNRLGAALDGRLLDIAAYDEFYLCGPEAMISGVTRGLRGLGVAESRIHFELFFASAADAEMVVARHQARAARYGDRVCRVTVKAGGRTTEFELPSDGENILDGALNAGIDVPFACRGGVCATCKARIVAGDVEMDLNHALDDAQVSQGLVLTCQAHPVGERVLVDYDV
jgi:ring-1,2-phenylacetyl-CoA epoxidase subunit PaaE